MSWFEWAACLSASVYNNNSLNTKVVTSREFLKYQVEKKPTYQFDSPKKEINIKLFPKADTLVDGILSCQRTEPWNAHTLIFQGAIRSVLPDYAQQLRLENADVPDIYFSFFSLLYLT